MIDFATAAQRAPKRAPAKNSPSPAPKREGEVPLRDALMRQAARRCARLVERGIISPAEAEAQVRRAGYAAAKPSEFRRLRTGLGGEADAHLGTELEYWRVREYARDMDRNDAVPGPVVDRAVSMILGTGIGMDPQTSRPKLNDELRRRWISWGEDPDAFDVAGKFDMAKMEELGLRHVLIDGDALSRPENEGPRAGRVQLLEGDRLAGSDPNGKVVHGIEQDLEAGRVVAYHVLKRQPDTRRFTGFRVPALGSENYVRLEAWTKEGRPNVWHLMDPKRITQGRGVTRFRGVFDLLGMYDDILYAATESHQVAACIPAFITSVLDVEMGARGYQNQQRSSADPVTRMAYEEITPGNIPRLLPGEGIQGVQGAGPPPQLEGHLRQLGRLTALNLDLPYTLAFLDTTGTTFHGYRGELDQAKRSCRRTQRWYSSAWHRPMYGWWVRRELAVMATQGWADDINAATKDGTIYRVRPQFPAWPYVEPETDVRADVMRVREGTDSARRVLGERGNDFDEILEEQVADRMKAIRRAEKAREDLAKEGIQAGYEKLLPQLLWPTQTAAGAPMQPTSGAPPMASADPKGSTVAGASTSASPVAPAGDVQATALNGAQVTSLLEVVQAVADDRLPAKAAVEMLVVAFPSIGKERAETIVNAAAAFEPEPAATGATPAPAPLAAVEKGTA